jgi:hypothetical protein
MQSVFWSAQRTERPSARHSQTGGLQYCLEILKVDLYAVFTKELQGRA